MGLGGVRSCVGPIGVGGLQQELSWGRSILQGFHFLRFTYCLRFISLIFYVCRRLGYRVHKGVILIYQGIPF